jgi:hypothetical protein
LEEATKTEFDATLSKTINIDVTVDDPMVEETILVNMKEDEDVDKYFNKLKSVDVQSIMLQISNLNTTGENKMTDGTLGFSAVTNEAETVIYSFQSLDLNALNTGSAIELNVTDEDLAKIEALLLSPGYLTFYLKGNVEQVPSNFTAVFSINPKVKAGL